MSAWRDVPLLTERCRRNPVGFEHGWLRSVRLDGPAVCHWCGATCDPIADLGDPAPAVRRRRARAEADASGDLFADGG